MVSTVIQKPGILKNQTCSVSFAPGTVCGSNNSSNTRKNTRANTGGPWRNPRATSTSDWPQTREASRADTSCCQRDTASTSRYTRRHSRRSKSRNRSNYPAASMKEWKLKTQELRKGISEVEHMQSSHNYSMWVTRNGKEQANKALKEARTQIATYESFLADYRQEHCNDTSRQPLADSWYPHSSGRSLASSWYPAASARSGPAPDPTPQIAPALHLPTVNRLIQDARGPQPRSAEGHPSRTEVIHAPPTREWLVPPIPPKKPAHPIPITQCRPVQSALWTQ